MDMWDAFYGPNAGYAQELYDRYLRDPHSVDEATRTFFESVPAPIEARPSTNGRSAQRSSAVAVSERAAPALDPLKIVTAARLARSIREYGHLEAHINPLGPPGEGDPMLRAETHGLTEEDLRAWSERVREPIERGSDVFCYFKHEEKGAGPVFAERMSALIGAAAPG